MQITKINKIYQSNFKVGFQANPIMKPAMEEDSFTRNSPYIDDIPYLREAWQECGDRIVYACKNPDGEYDSQALKFAVELTRRTNNKMTNQVILAINACKENDKINPDALDTLESIFSQTSDALLEKIVNSKPPINEIIDTLLYIFTPYRDSSLYNFAGEIISSCKQYNGTFSKPALNVIKNQYKKLKHEYDAESLMSVVHVLLKKEHSAQIMNSALTNENFELNSDILSVEKLIRFAGRNSELQAFAKKIAANNNCTFPMINNIINNIRDTLDESIIENINSEDVPIEVYSTPYRENQYYLDLFEDEQNIYNKFNLIKNTIMKNPMLYISGDNYKTEIDAKRNLRNHLNFHLLSYMILADLFDEETINIMLRKRTNKMEKYFEKIFDGISVDYEMPFDIKTNKKYHLLKSMINGKDIDGREFSPAEKINMIDIFTTWSNLKIKDKVGIEIENQIRSGIVDTKRINRIILYKALLNAGMTVDEIKALPKDNIFSWNINKIGLINHKYKDENLYAILKYATQGDFKEYITDESNEFGENNKQTKLEFQKLKMDYDKWLNPDKNLEVKFCRTDKNNEKLQQIASSITEEIERLRQGGAGNYVDKQLKKYIDKEHFVIPADITNNKNLLKTYTQNVLITQLHKVWENAKNNSKSSNSEIARTARDTLTILNHLQLNVDSLKKSDFETSSQNYDLTIKIWDRIPQKDLFQGNYSTCCIGIGETNEEAMPNYLLDTAYNMIELVDNNDGETIGNALCYFVKDKNNKPIFVIDNIEIKNSRKPSIEIGKEIRNALTEYASRICTSVCGNDNIPIYMSDNYNDVPIEDLPHEKVYMSFVGKNHEDRIYLDMYNGWRDTDDLEKHTFSLKLK